MIPDVISNDPILKKDMFLHRNGWKTSFKNIDMVTKMLHAYISSKSQTDPWFYL